MRRKAKVDANQSAIVFALRQAGAKVLHLHMVGEGVPDLLIGAGKRLGFVEVKDSAKPPSARKLTEAQIAFWDEWDGYPMALVEDIDGALRFYSVLRACK